jgi:hypothetical protein
MRPLTESRCPGDDEWGGDCETKHWGASGAKLHSDLSMFGKVMVYQGCIRALSGN